MNFNLFLIVLIAFIIIFSIILYNGLKILLIVEKKESIAKYELKATMLKIPIFKRSSTKGNGNGADDEEESEDKSKQDKESNKSKKESEDKSKQDKESNKSKKESEDKTLKEKYGEIKPIINHLKNSKEELKEYLKDILKTIDLRKLEGNLIIGLDDHTSTVKITSFIWSIGAIVNSAKPAPLTVEPKFTEEILDFEGKVELKINLLILLIYSLVLLSKTSFRELIKELYRQRKSKKEEMDEKKAVRI